MAAATDSFGIYLRSGASGELVTGIQALSG